MLIGYVEPGKCAGAVCNDVGVPGDVHRGGSGMRVMGVFDDER